MDDIESWKEGKAKETIGQNLIYWILQFAGYKIYKFGIENFVEDMKNEIKGNYDSDTNLRILCMPDYVIVDPETKTSVLVEIKYREKKSNTKIFEDILFRYRTINNYIKYWEDMILIIVSNARPNIRCITVKDIDWNIHLHGKIRIGKKKVDELWNFNGIEKDIKDIFPRVHAEHIFKAKKLLKFEDIN